MEHMTETIRTHGGKELETIQRLRKACELAESLIAGGFIVSHESISIEKPFDFIVGDFAVTNLRGKGWRPVTFPNFEARCPVCRDTGIIDYLNQWGEPDQKDCPNGCEQ